ncbi:A/G-specific adenine glycosylase [Adhaeribacter sp. BT258]|uniref:Adenine DNA glycosylase n=1 Tax=Adhaeribacter terrigena TaxID=2793070 RepID=A0ABS1C4Y5_9BACT|nr:A/G-specific adenine glycosylase [Adhaeribacter terrigena]MBK0404449.1 A/G-specific adenine glycosylase [Adhaeribacter terrigena]
MLPPEPAFFAETLLNWYKKHFRPLPWRETTNPYAIWLSEIILQQTRVNQGLPYYHTFLTAYPTVHDLANAPEDEVLRHWQGLGYYSRARNLHQTAKFVSEELGGFFPENYTDLLKLKGVGTYTAAAIASFAFKEQVAVLDGNVFRVLSRVFGISDDILSPLGKRTFQDLANKLVPANEPDTYNQAIMEFGAIQCTPVMPDCLFCPLQDHCYAFKHGLVTVLPHKSKAKAPRVRHFHYFVFQFGEDFYLKKRLPGDIWQGLYDFHLLESDTKALSLDEMIAELGILQQDVPMPNIKMPSPAYKHVLSHQKVFAAFYHILLESPLSQNVTNSTGLSFYSKSEIEALPKPVLINNYLKDAIFK